MSAESLQSHERRAERRAQILWALLARAYHHSLRDIEVTLEPHDLTVMEFDVLAHVGAAPGLTQQHLAERLLVTKGNVTYQLTKLEQQQLIERCPNGRRNHLHLTERGRQLVQRAATDLKALHTRQFAHLTPREQDQLTALMRKVLAPERRPPDPHAPLQEV